MHLKEQESSIQRATREERSENQEDPKVRRKLDTFQELRETKALEFRKKWITRGEELGRDQTTQGNASFQQDLDFYPRGKGNP